MYPIQDDIPRPTVTVGRRLTYPFDKMLPGQSFPVDLDGVEAQRVVDRMRTAANNWAKRQKNGKHFTVRVVRENPDGSPVTAEKPGVERVRVWLD